MPVDASRSQAKVSWVRSAGEGWCVSLDCHVAPPRPIGALIPVRLVLVSSGSISPSSDGRCSVTSVRCR